MAETCKTACAVAALFYLCAAAFFGSAFVRAIPAANMAGGVYVGLTWPAWIKGSPIPAPPIPAWAFTFKADEA